MRLSFVVVCMLGACVARADVYYDFETSATSPVWFGTTQMIQNTSASHQGTNAIALTGSFPNGYVITQLPQATTNLAFFFYDDCGPNPAGSQYMFFRLLEATNSTALAGFSMLDGGWGTTPPMTMNHYYAWGQEEYSARTMGPLRTVGWHKFTFALGPRSFAMSVDDTLVFQTNMIRTARYLQLQCGNSGGWGRVDDMSVSTGTWPPPPVHYVNLNNATPAAPYTNWASAATDIQSAVDVANDWDEILVANGVYETGTRVVSGGTAMNRVAVTKPVTLRSVNGPGATVIRGKSPISDSAVRCVYLANGATLIGFTLNNGATQFSTRDVAGGGVCCDSTTVVVSNCVLTGNSASTGGGAYYGTLNNCVLTGNFAGAGGGGASQSTLNNCTLTGNTAYGQYGSGGGGAFWCTLNNCTVAFNSAPSQYGSGGGALNTALNNCILYYNNSPTGPNHYYPYDHGTFNYCCTTPLPGGTGNFTSAPLFVDQAGGNLRPQPNSPCVNAGNGAYVVGTTDLDGRSRIVFGTVDVGAYEYQGFSLNVTSTPGGSVIPSPDQPAYWPGSQVTLTATPMAGFAFIRWTGDAAGNANPLTVTADSDKNITAVFASMALTLASQGVGTITKVPDQPFYAVGDQVTLAATAGRWHLFSAWTDGNTNNPRLVTIGESNAYTAVFTPTTPLDTVTIAGVSRLAPVGMPAVVVDEVFILTPSASVRGSASVTLSTTLPSGWLFYTLDGSDPAASGAFFTKPFAVGHTSLLRTIAYNSDFTQSVAGDPVSIVILPTLTGLTDGGGSVAIEPPSGDYFSNSLAVVTATPTPGWTFLQWLDDASGTNPVVTLSMTRNKTVRAVFGTALNTTVVGSGSILVSPVVPWRPYGSQVRLTAVPVTGNYLVFWANAAAGLTNNPLTFTITNASPTVTAVFANLGGTQTNALTVIPDGRGQVTLTPPGNRFPLNTNVVLQATPDTGQEFLGWSGAASGSDNPLLVTMNSNKVIAASFTKRPSLQVSTVLEGLFKDGFRLTLAGEFGGEYLILGSTNLLDWLPTGTVTNTYGTVQFTDPAATNSPYGFYRALSVGP